MLRTFQEAKPKYRRAKALYDCEADHDDELSFQEGDIILIKKEADPEWWVSGDIMVILQLLV